HGSERRSPELGEPFSLVLAPACFLGALHIRPSAPVCGFPLGLAANLVAERPLVGGLLREHFRVEKPVVLARVGFERIFEAEDSATGLTSLFGSPARILTQRGD